MNGTNQTLRVEVQDSKWGVDVLSDALPPGRRLWFAAVIGGSSEADFGQLRAFDVDGTLVFERDFTLTGEMTSCRIFVSDSVQNAERVDCVRDWNREKEAGHASTYLIRTDSTDWLNVSVGGGWDYLSAAHPVEVRVSGDGPRSIQVWTQDGRGQFSRQLYVTDIPGVQEVTVVLAP